MDSKSKIIVIKDGSTASFDTFDNVYKYFKKWSYGLFFRAFRKTLKYVHLDFVDHLFYDKWRKKLGSVSTVILFDAKDEYSDYIPKYIKSKNENIKIIFWYWNAIKSHNDKLVTSKYIDEIWTYNRFDADKYNLKYSPQFYNFDFCKIEKNNEEKNVHSSDIVFLGKDKGRKKDLLDLEEKFTKIGLKCNFMIVEKRTDKVNYLDYLKLVGGSKCILDFNYLLPCGISLRPLEAVGMRKKLITNNPDVINYRFYDKDNIFIIGKDDLNRVIDFVNSPFKKVKQNYIDYYSFSAWLKRLSEGLEDEK